MARNYDPNASKEVEKTMHEHKHEGKFKNRKQAIAVGLNKARRKGERVPEKSREDQASIYVRRVYKHYYFTYHWWLAVSVAGGDVGVIASVVRGVIGTMIIGGFLSSALSGGNKIYHSFLWVWCPISIHWFFDPCTYSQCCAALSAPH